MLFVIVNTAAFFALDAHHCNNTTGSRGKELHRAGHREKSAFTNTPISTFCVRSLISCHGFCTVFRLGWAHSLHHMGSLVSCHLGIATTTDGLRHGSSLHDISSGRPHGQNLVYPIAYIIITTPLINTIGYCLFYNARFFCNCACLCF